MEMSNVPKKLLPKGTKARPGGALRAGTLVCCPVIALHQWKEEIERFTDGNPLTICVYHGPNRAKEFPRELLVKYDIVLTTYQVIEAEYRKMVSPNKVKCPNCGNKFKIDKLRIHLKYFCGEGAQRTEAQARQRRTADNGRRGGGSRPSSVSKKKGFAKKSSAKQAGSGKSKTKSKVGSARKSVIRLKGTTDYDTDDDLSIPDDVAPVSASSSRPSRSAAKVAAQKLSASAKESHESDESDDSDTDDSSSGVGSGTSDSSSAEEFSSDDEAKLSTRKKRVVTKSVSKPTRGDSCDSSEDEDGDSDSDSDDDDAAKRALEKQRLAIEQASKKKTGKGTKQTKKPLMKGGGKKLAVKKKSAKKPVTSGKRKKPPMSSPSSDESSGSDTGGDEDRDPLEGIDMEELMDEAMAGSRVSPLHTLCWWRIVLGKSSFDLSGAWNAVAERTSQFELS